MHPRKTDLARSALQAHRAPLDMRQRRLLILCDGQRDTTELTALLGSDAVAMVQALIHSGYLSSGAEVAPAAAPPPAPAPVAPSPPSSPPAAATPVERRRSLVAARIYVLGILEMQRHPQAAGLLRNLQQARVETDVLAGLQAALQALPALTSEGYSQRVRERLLEALPLEHCPAFTG
ncbi:hypothetical protein [Stenotrophomonas sp. 24(2023)]|uniref:hypothetical protein n=1 Tax=Stenotrophomonas sp. 24(2023) TaxID=3068324 RepID=UPI0027E00995|nr:hypothetical protein [Stenotrophomonas sp. 24(2023)]WMJ70788.1 hypothetical protein Q9R17_06725 [Stenotrophomonas sp. 24(2023)]